MIRHLIRVAALAALPLLFGQQAFASSCPVGGPPSNCPPPSGPVILDLAGQAVPHSYTAYSVNFTASGALTNLSFAFREDPAFLLLTDVSMTTGGGSNLVTNGTFTDTPGVEPAGWTYLNTFGATFGGVVGTSGECTAGGVPHSATCYYDGAVQAYDGITQSIATTIGATYTVTFNLSDDGGLSTFQQLSTNGNVTSTGGNGIDLLVYAGNIPTRAPEPASLALLGAGLAGLGLIRRRR